jgi:foldase protein PrsA
MSIRVSGRSADQSLPPAVLPALLLLVVAGLGLSACSDTAPVGTSPAATVAGAEITDQQVADAAAIYRFIAGVNQQPCGTAEGGESQESACNRFALSNLIQFEVTEAYAAEHQISADDKDIDSALSGLDEQYGAETVDAQLAQNGVTRDQLRELARDLFVAREVSQAVTADQLGDEQLRQEYQRNIARYTTVEVDHILVKTEAEARDVYRQVTASDSTREDFLALAKQVSIDPTVKQNSGSLPSSNAGQYVPEFANAAVALRPGEISEPVQTQYGWHVIRLESMQVTPFEQARDQILQAQSTTVFNGWLRGQLGEDLLQVNPRYGRFDVETLTVVRISSTDPNAMPTPSQDAAASVVPSAPPG